MFSMLPPTPAHASIYNFTTNHSLHHTPHVPSPLSSSPLRLSPTPSPLSPRNGNLPSRSNASFDPNEDDKMMMSPTPSPSKCKPRSGNSVKAERNPLYQLPSQRETQTPIISLPSPPPSRGKGDRESTFAKRPSKPNPLFHRGDGDGRETRRKLFLKRVREGSEDKRWRDRGGDEEIMRVLWVGEERERKRREELGLRAALDGDVGVEDEFPEYEFPEDETNLDEVMADEEAELEALFGDMQKQEWQHQSSHPGWGLQSQHQLFEEKQSRAESIYGSDDEEYDRIFMDVIQEESRQASQEQQRQSPGYLQPSQDEEMMDLS
ncbi:hypothetical protein G7Y89_g15285 [Cudoniella acicularis]|uniref:Uncharacterized protein n=1 Tax=Cudoniella acicularis TaxID=354080 RepID=A0A8H4QSL7_9HELO|nr:hypothetical protein G7Y89_g15285 [Cudoniella acicularis]